MSFAALMNQNPVCRRVITVREKDGLHLRPLSQIAQAAQKFSCDVQIRKDENVVNAKSMLELMTLEATCGSVLHLETTGDGADDAIEQLVQLFQSNFDVDLSPNP